MNNLKINFKAIALIGATVLTFTTLSSTVSFDKSPYEYVPSIFETYDFNKEDNNEKSLNSKTKKLIKSRKKLQNSFRTKFQM